jgi:hypothetical protein
VEVSEASEAGKLVKFVGGGRKLEAVQEIEGPLNTFGAGREVEPFTRSTSAGFLLSYCSSLNGE